jgi:signal transduction histidine kinase
MNTAIIAADAMLGPEAARANADNILWLEQLSTEIRTLSHLLHPPLLDEAGLESALAWYVDGFSARSSIQVQLNIAADFGRLSPDLETTVFRLVQECLTNVHRHSRATAASILLSRDHAEVRLKVED